jgi:NAD(P)H-flavin reductase
LPSAVLSSRRDAGGGLTLVSLDVEPPFAQSYAAPGQYVELLTPKGKGFFVLAGVCGASPWQLLVRDAGDAADVLVHAELGTTLEIRGPLGKGFPVERAREGHLVVAVVGSALAVARPLLRIRRDEGTTRATHVYIGARSIADLPLVEELEAWSEAGAELVLCLSRGELDHDRERLLPGRREAGYVQDVVARDVEGGRIPRALVFAAGPETMMAAMRDLPNRVLEVVTNV